MVLNYRKSRNASTSETKQGLSLEELAANYRRFKIAQLKLYERLIPQGIFLSDFNNLYLIWE